MLLARKSSKKSGVCLRLLAKKKSGQMIVILKMLGLRVLIFKSIFTA